MNVPSSDKRPIGPPSFIGEPPDWYKKQVMEYKKGKFVDTNTGEEIPDNTTPLPPTKTLRDEVAIAALTGILACRCTLGNENEIEKTYVPLALRAAEAYMKEREKK